MVLAGFVVVVIAQQLFSYRQLSRLRKSATTAGLSHMSCTVSCVRWLWQLNRCSMECGATPHSGQTSHYCLWFICSRNPWFLASCTACSMIGYWRHNVLCLSVYCGWMIHTTAEVSAQVNRKCPPMNTTVQFSIPYTDPEPSNSLLRSPQ